ncbi:ABC transporter permease EcsB [Staphylococcus felis]|uniref:ABC transporter permease EcsB n=1 Tax=Staphylococcus felis TaxID=46127 RepID=UPI0021CF0ACB|nr:ABC transporter permease [Staphylococcus felis]UXR87677.1 ABC transporter permease [Staphylococcus felis]
MITSKALFKKRLKAQRKERNYYNKFIFNGHFAIFLTILLGAFILGYGQWLKDVPSGVNYSLIVSIALSVSSIFPLKTLLEDADQLFLLPFEKEMKKYIRESIVMSYFARVSLQIILLIIIFPLLNAIHPNQVTNFVIVCILAIVLPLLGLFLRWEWYLYGLENWSCNGVLFILNLSGFYVIIDGSSYFGFGSIVFTILLTLLLKNINAKKHFPWALMIAQAQQHRMNYYKFVNMFTDVKGMTAPAVRRKYLDVFLKAPKHFDSHHMYPFLFVRNFLRGKDAFNITLRLVVITAVLMIWLSHPIVSSVIGGLAMYMIILQMSQFYTQEAYSLWPQVWPVSEVKVIEGYQSFLNKVVVILGIVLSIIYLIMNISHFYMIIIFFIVGILTVKSTIKKLKYQETLLKD